MSVFKPGKTGPIVAESTTALRIKGYRGFAAWRQRYRSVLKVEIDGLEIA
jgi:hypothetical protein